MSIEALAGLLALNALYFAAGLAILWLVQGLPTWLEAARLAGLAYIVGVAVVGTSWTLLLVAGIPFSCALVVAIPLGIVCAALPSGWLRGRRLPSVGSTKGSTWSLGTAAGMAATIVFLEALFRSARLHGLYAWDAWSFWVPKGQAIYYFGRLDEQFFTHLPGPSYPPILPALDAAAFYAMGGPDVVTLHVQFWFLGMGFLWALAGLLAERVPPWVLWPVILLLVVAPRIGRRMIIPEADLVLGYFVALSALLIAFWVIDEQRRSYLVLATLLLGAAVMTKREGMLFAATILVSAALANGRTARRALPALGLVAAMVAAIGAPWRVWYSLRGVPGEGPPGGLLGPVDRAWPSLRLALDVLFDASWWGVSVSVGLGALVVGLLARRVRLTVYVAAFVGLATLGGGWITWSIEELEITSELGANPIVRYMGTVVLVLVAGAALLLGEAWRTTLEPRVIRRGNRHRLVPAVAAVVIPALAYPAFTLAGGAPPFPTRDECARPPIEGQPVDVVFGRFDHPDEAAARRDRALEVGFIGTEALPDGCGRWIAVLQDVPTRELGEEIQRQARSVDLDPMLEASGE